MPERGNLFDGADGRADTEVITTVFEQPAATLERIVSLGQATPADEPMVQARDEWVVLLRGSARLQFEGEDERELAPGDYVFIAQGTPHRVTWTTADEPTIWLAVHLA